MNTDTLRIRRTNYEVHQFTGKVIQANKHLESRVFGIGTGNLNYHGNMAQAQISVNSKIRTHDDIFLLNELGQEQAFQLVDWDIATRENHLIQVIWLIKAGEESRDYLIWNNLSLHQTQWNQALIEQLLRPAWWMILIVPVIIFFVVVAILGWFIVLLALISYFYLAIHIPFHNAKHTLVSQLTPYIKNAPIYSVLKKHN